MSLYSRFCAWLSGWPEASHSTASHGRSNRNEDMMFAEEEKKDRMRKAKKPKGLKSKKKSKK